MNQLVSIILPVYNRKNLLPDCMTSIFAQTHQQLQIIIIDDGSTDGTAELCHAYAQQDPRVMVLTGSHKGVSAARNLGLDAATGKYLFFLDSDDVIHPALIETLYQAMERTGATMGGSPVINISERQWAVVPSLIAQQKKPDEVTFHDYQETIYNFYHGKTPFGVIGSTMLRRDFVGQTRFSTELFIGEDYYFLYQNLIKGASSIFLKNKWYYCRIHGGNSSFSYHYDGFWTRFLRRKLVWESEITLGRPENANKEKHSTFMAYLACLQKNQMSKSEEKKMCTIMRQHRKDILPALNLPRKLRFYLTVYFPWTHRIYCRIFKK